MEGVDLWYTNFVCSSLIPLTQTGATPLYISSQNGHPDTVNTLIQNGADINWPRNVYREGVKNLCLSLIPLT